MKISIKDKLPPENVYILIHLTKNNWIDSDDKEGKRYWKDKKQNAKYQVE